MLTMTVELSVSCNHCNNISDSHELLLPVVLVPGSCAGHADFERSCISWTPQSVLSRICNTSDPCQFDDMKCGG